MKYLLQDRNKHELVEIALDFHPVAIRNMLLDRRDGFIWRALKLVLALVVLLICAGLQMNWPGFFPELPCYPLLLFLLFWINGHAWFTGLILAIMGGAVLGTGTLVPWTGQAAVLIAVMLTVRFLADCVPLKKYPLCGVFLQGGLGSFLYVLIILIFQAGELGALSRLRLLFFRGVPAAVAGGLLFAPVIYMICELLFRKNRADSHERQ